MSSTTRFPESSGSIRGDADTAPLGGRPALDEPDRAVSEPGLKGVVMNAQVDGQPLDSRQLWPFYEKVSRLKVPIFVHPSIKVPGFEACKTPYDLTRTLVREFDLSLAIFRLCVGGVLEEFPGLVFIMAHFGGGYSAVKERMDRSGRSLNSRCWKIRAAGRRSADADTNPVDLSVPDIA